MLTQFKGETSTRSRLIALLSLEKCCSCTTCSVRSLAPGLRRGLFGYARDACLVTKLCARRDPCTSRATIRLPSLMLRQEELQTRFKEIATVGPVCGSPRFRVPLCSEDWLVTHKRTERVHRLKRQDLSRNHPRRRTSVVTRGPSAVPMRRIER